MSKFICDTCIHRNGAKCEKFLVPALATKCMHHTRTFKVLGWTITITSGVKEARVCK